MLATLLGYVLVTSPMIEPPPAAPRAFRGAWIASIDHIDWPPRDVLSTAKQQQALINILDRAQQLHLNAVILQVRPMGDALYRSPFEPWSEWLSGTQGKAPQPYWDPLEFAVWEAHLRGLELHAWFNPYRVWHPAAKSPPASNYLGYTHPKWVRTYGKFQWLDPGERGVQDWVQNVIIDVVKRYDIDGIHIDDYFYPYPISGVSFPDDASWNAYVSSGGRLNRADWRRHNVDEFVSTLYRRIKEEKSWVKFGVSPFGIYRPGVPKGIEAGVDQYNGLYADPVKWLANGWCDYMSPQLYWPIHQKPQSFPVLAHWWAEQNPLHRHLWIGHFASQVGKWPAEEIINQIDITKTIPSETGNVLYSMAPLMKNAGGLDQKLSFGPFGEPAVSPACPWLKSSAPKAPRVSVMKSAEGDVVSLVKESADSYQWAMYIRRNGRWQFTRLYSAQQNKLLVTPRTFGFGLQAMAISALDRYGNESERVVVAF